MPSLLYPLINGHRASWAEIEFRLAQLRTIGIREIAYKPSQGPEDIYGAGVLPLGRTRGQVKFEGSFTLLKEEADALLAQLGNGYGEKSFDVFLAYRLDGVGAVHSDKLFGCRIKSVDQSYAQGSDGLLVKFDLSIMDIRINGLSITSMSAKATT